MNRNERRHAAKLARKHSKTSYKSIDTKPTFTEWKSSATRGIKLAIDFTMNIGTCKYNMFAGYSAKTVQLNKETDYDSEEMFALLADHSGNLMAVKYGAPLTPAQQLQFQESIRNVALALLTLQKNDEHREVVLEFPDRCMKTTLSMSKNGNIGFDLLEYDDHQSMLLMTGLERGFNESQADFYVTT